MYLLDFAKENITKFIPHHEPDMLYDYEIDTLSHISVNDYSSITKSRGVGMSSLYSLYIIWLCRYQPFPIENIVVINSYYSIKNIVSKYIHEQTSIITGESRSKIYYKQNLQFYGIKIIFIDEGDYGNLYGCKFNVIIFDEALDVKNIDNIFSIIYPQIRNTNHIKFSMASSLNNNNNFNMINSHVYLNNYILHYSQTPMWNFERLEELLSTEPSNLWWAQMMDCHIINHENREFFEQKEIELKPFKSKRVLKLEQEMLKQINNA